MDEIKLSYEVLDMILIGLKDGEDHYIYDIISNTVETQPDAKLNKSIWDLLWNAGHIAGAIPDKWEHVIEP